MPLFGEELVTRTKFIAPTPRRAHLDRVRLYERYLTTFAINVGES